MNYIRSRKHAVTMAGAVSIMVVSAASAHAAETAATAPTAAEQQASAVDSVTVKGKRQKVQSPKFTQPLIDTPQTIQVISKDLFNEQGATSLAEALRNSPGVGTFSVGENGNTRTGDAIFMRGFDTSSNIYVDGARDLGSISRDIFNTEQVEVQKGPAGTDNGRGAPSGSINMVSKQASLSNAASSLASFGVDGQKRVTFDVNQALTAIPNAAFRLNVLWQDSDVPGRDHLNNKRIGIAPSLGIGLGTATRAWANLLYVKQDNIPDGGVPIVGLPGWRPLGTGAALTYFVNNPLPTSNFYGTRADHDDVEAYMGTLHLEHDFSDTLKLTNVARYGRTTQDYLITSFMQPATNASTNPDNFTVARGNNRQDSKNEIWTDQLSLRADFSTGAISHNLVAGAEVIRERQFNYNNLTAGTRPAANLLNPNFNDSDPFTVYRNAQAPVLNRGQTDTQALYLFDTAKFLDGALLVTGGIRLDHYKTSYRAVAACNNTTLSCGALPVGNFVTSVDLDHKDTLFNWKIGAVYKPAENISLYTNYAISQQPPGGSAFTLTSTAGANSTSFDPQKAKTAEAGVKWATFGQKLMLNAAIFQTTNENEVFTDPLDPTDLQSGERRVKGVELTALGSITDAWSISAGYTHLDAKIAVGTINTSDGTNNLIYTPGDSATLWTTYKLPFGLEIGGGARYNAGLHKQSDGGDANGTPAATKGYTVIDATLAYPLTENVKLRLNASNLFDKEYIAAINKSGYRYTPAQPRTFMLTADVRF